MGKITCRICGDKFSTEEQDYTPFIEIKKENRNPFYICSNCIEAMHNEINTYMFDDNLKKAFGEDVPKKQMSLEQCLEFIDVDELLEVTPQNLRIRKKILDPTLRKRASMKK